MVSNIKKFAFSVRHTYIIGHYNPSVGIIDLVFHTIYVMFVNFIHKWRDFFEKLFMADFQFTLGVFARNLLRGNRRRNIYFFSYFVLVPDLGYEPGLDV